MDQFEAHRPHLHAVATRILGSAADADDALQEAWIRVTRAGTDGVENVGGWLTTVVARVCLNMLDQRRRRRQDPLDERRVPDPILVQGDPSAAGPEDEALAADAVGAALLVVLDSLTPSERLAFVLHDLFAVPFEEIAQIVDRSPAATRQLASRARRRVQGAEPDAPTADREVVDAFLAAARGGDFERLLRVLDPDVVLRTDDGSGALRIVAGAQAVAGGATLYQRDAPAGRTVVPVVVDGRAGIVSFDGDEPVSLLWFSVTDGRITNIDGLVGRARLDAVDLSAVVAR